MRGGRVVSLVLSVLLVAACGGGGDDDEAAGAAASADETSATLAILSTNIESALGGEDFAEASEGQRLVVGDQVRTDDTGFAEVEYHDGSWQRVESEATLTIVALRADGDVNVVRTAVDVGRSWNNVQELAEPEDAYEVETPVATAAVRGTVFATECPTVAECTFSVVEGEVEVTPIGGAPVIVGAGQVLTVEADVAPDAPVAFEPDDDEWVVRNLDLDADRPTVAPGDDEVGDAEDETAAIDLPDPCTLMTADEATLIGTTNSTGATHTGTESVDASAQFPEWSTCSWRVHSENAAEAHTYTSSVTLALRQVDADTCITDTDGRSLGLGERSRLGPVGGHAAVAIDGVCVTIAGGGEFDGMPPSDAIHAAFVDVLSAVIDRLRGDAPAVPTTVVAAEPQTNDEPVESSPGVG